MSEEKRTIESRQEKDKTEIIEQLKRTPIVEIGCKKAGVGRSTYYRWRKEDKEFLKASDEAIEIGSSFINDMAESQLITAIKDGNMTGLIFWLKNHHSVYTNKLELTAKIKEDEELSPEQKEVVKQALQLASLSSNNQTYEKHNNTTKPRENNPENDRKPEDKSGNN